MFVIYLECIRGDATANPELMVGREWSLVIPVAQFGGQDEMELDAVESGES